MKKVVAVAIAALVAAPVFAGDLYVVGSVGQSTMNISKSDIDGDLVSAGVTGLSSSLDKESTGYKLQLGYQVNPYFAVEGGYIDLGEAEYKATFAGGSGKATASASGWNVAALGVLPINNSISVFGKVGAIAANVKAKAEATGPGGSASGSESVTNWETYFGLGASYNVTKQVAVRVEYEHFNDLGDKKKTGETDVSLLSAGLVIKF